MSVGHAENFPVASVLLPAALRHPVSVIYRFARTADDFADEGVLAPAERLACLEGYRAELRRLEAGHPPASALFRELGEVATAYRLPLAPFHDLLDAFSQDVTKIRYATFAELMDYCRRSADPVGRLMLHLYGEAGHENVACSDAICSALQLINFWQDVQIDFRKNRIYLPQEDMARFGVTEDQIAADDVAWRAARRAAAGTHRIGDPHRGSGRPEDPGEARAGTRKRFPPPPGVAPLGLAADARARAGDAV